VKPDEAPVAALFDGVVGQERAVELLRAAAHRPQHAYLFLGPPGSGKREAARGFAAALLCPEGGCGTCRHCRLALAGTHPDLVEVERDGPAITAEMARQVVTLAGRVPLEADRQVLLLDEIHLMRPDVAPRLLKTLEEPAPRTVFLLLADDLLPEMATIASRCVRVAFGPVPAPLIAATLEREGVDPATAAAAAEASSGDLDRARLLAADPDLAARRAAWAALPRRLDGTGATVAAAVDELLAGIAAAAAPLLARQAEELAALEARVAQFGERGSGRSELEERHKRELRRHRTDELRAGLATLAGAYREQLVRGEAGAEAVRALAAVQEAAEAFERNPNEVLLLQALLLRLGGS